MRDLTPPAPLPGTGRGGTSGVQGRGRGFLPAVCVLAAALTFPVGIRASTAAPTFSCHLVGDTGKNPFDVVAGDWNRDGRTDLAVSYTTTGTLSTFLNTGPRQYRPQPEIKLAEVARGIAVGDYDRDGALDLAVANVGGNETVLLHNDGKGSFAIAARLVSGFAPFGAAFSDLDDDGRLDLVVVNESNMAGGRLPGIVGVYYDVSPASRSPLLLQGGTFPSDVAIGNFDGQPGLDLAVSNWGSGDVSLFMATAARVFGPASTVAFGGALAYSIFADDLTGDGILDLALADVTRGALWVLQGDGKGSFAPRTPVGVGAGTRSVRGGDINGDGRLDLVTANTAAGTVAIAYGKGGGELGDVQSIPVGPTPRMVLVRDLDADGKLDIAVTVMGAKDVALLFQTPGQSVPCMPPVPVPVAAAPQEKR